MERGNGSDDSTWMNENWNYHASLGAETTIRRYSRPGWFETTCTYMYLTRDDDDDDDDDGIESHEFSLSLDRYLRSGTVRR